MTYEDFIQRMQAVKKPQPAPTMEPCEHCKASGWHEGDPWDDENDYMCGGCNGVGWVDPD